MWLLTPLVWFTIGATVPLTGTVEDSAGKPVEGASVWLADTYYYVGKTSEILAEGKTDAQGRFRLDRADNLRGRGDSWSPTLWVFQPGNRVAFREFKHAIPGPDEPVKVVLEPSTQTTLRVLMPDGQAASGAKVRPVQVTFKAPGPPKSLLQKIGATTGLDGRANLDGLRPEDVSTVDVTVDGSVTQHLNLSTEPGERVVRFRPIGRVAARIVGDDPKAIQGWTVTATTTPNEPDNQGPSTSWARTKSDLLGLAELRALPVGRISWKIVPPPDSPYRAIPPSTVTIREGERLEVPVLIRKATRVEGTIVEGPAGLPIPGMMVQVLNFKARGDDEDPVTDLNGHFTSYQLPGTIRVSVLPWKIPRTHYRPPIGQDWADFEIKEGQRVEVIPPIEFRKAAQVRGRVIDEAGRPAAGVSVQARWTLPEFNGTQSGSNETTDPQGNFLIGSIAPGAQTYVSAAMGQVAAASYVTVTAGDGQDVTLKLVRFPTLALGGRVLGPDGKPQGGATIRIQTRQKTDPSFINGTYFSFGSTGEVKTATDGTFLTPKEIPVGNQYRAEVKAPGFDPAMSTWVDDSARGFPDLTIRRSTRSRVVLGRVVDTGGKPVEGAEVYQSGDGPKLTRGFTDLDGRFQVAGVPDTPAFLFVRKAGHRLVGRRVDPGDSTVDFKVPRLDEAPLAFLKATPSAIARAEERAIGRDLLAPVLKQAGRGDTFPNGSNTYVLMARLDPDRIEAMIENQVIAADPGLLVALDEARAEDNPRKAIETLEAGEPETAAYSMIQMFDQVPRKSVDLKRDLLDRASKAARLSAHADRKVDYLARIADRWFDLDDPARGTTIAREAQAVAATIPKSPQDFSPFRLDLAYALARIDLPAALKLLDEETQDHSRDTGRSEIARRVASTNPAEAQRLLGLIKNEFSLYRARQEISLALAGRDLPLAQALAREDKDEVHLAALPAIAARSLASTDPSRSKDLLLESMTRLGQIAGSRTLASQSTQGLSPAVVMARLLPLAIRIDPDRAPGYLWLTLASRPRRPIEPEPRPVMPWHRQVYVDLAEVAMLIAPYDRVAAEAVFAPVLARVPGMDDETWGLGNEGDTIFKAAAAFDARAALTLFNALPEDPLPPTDPAQYSTNAMKYQHKTKEKARRAIAMTLGLAPDRRVSEALRHTNQSNYPWLAELDD